MRTLRILTCMLLIILFVAPVGIEAYRQYGEESWRDYTVRRSVEMGIATDSDVRTYRQIRQIEALEEISENLEQIRENQERIDYFDCWE